MWTVLKTTAANWSRHNTARIGAALAYYSIFSIGPIIVISVAIAGAVFGPEAARGEITNEIRGLLGSAGAQAIEAMLVGASRPRQGILATLLGIGTLVFAAVGVVVQLKGALNTIWNVDATPNSGYWKGGLYEFKFAVPHNYPAVGPKVTCIDKVSQHQHPNSDAVTR